MVQLAVVSTVIAATLGMVAAYSGGWVDDVLNTVTNIFIVIPALPLLIVVYSFIPQRGPVPMVLILGLTILNLRYFRTSEQMQGQT